MDTETSPNASADALDASFDIVARQDAADQALGALRGDVEEVKSRLDKVSRAASRPATFPPVPSSRASSTATCARAATASSNR
jgi:hypothetical protein